MAVYLNGKKYLNNMERETASAVKYVSADDISLVNGDIIGLGALPRESITLDLVCIVPEDWQPDPSTTTFSIGYYEQASGTFTPFATDVQMKRGKVIIPGPIAGSINPDGTPYTGDQLVLWNGYKETEIAVMYTGTATPVPNSEVHFIFNNIYYGTKNGKYGLDHVPMKPTRV